MRVQLDFLKPAFIIKVICLFRTGIFCHFKLCRISPHFAPFRCSFGSCRISKYFPREARSHKQKSRYCKVHS